MKKIYFALLLILLSSIGNAQSKKWNQLSVRGGFDQAHKSNFTPYTKAKLNGFVGGLSFDKYWSWYGVGVDFDVLQNEKSSYDSTGQASRLGWNNAWTSNTSATKLQRYFLGIGPSLKLQNVKNNIVAELNLRGGITNTNGSALQYSTIAKPLWIPWFTRTGSTNGTFYHDGYKNELLTTLKAQLRVNYYVKPKIGINIGGYYMHYFGSKAKYNYLDVNTLPVSAGAPWYWNLPAKNGLTALSSYGVTLGATYRLMGTSAAPKTKKVSAKSSAAVTVKDELTSQPIIGATVTITNANGKTYTSITNVAGVASFEKIEDGVYNAKAELNTIPTNEQSFSVAKSAATASLTHNDPRFTVVGKAVNKTTSSPEAGVSVSLKNDSKGSVKMATSQSGSGSFSFQIDANSDYTLVGKKDSYISNIERVSTKGLTRSQTLYVELEVGVEKVEAGKPLTLQNIYYDLDKADIKQDASSDLEKLTVFLQDNPGFNVEVASHTDNRGADDYNLKLSLQRAQNVVSYLISKGINKDRLAAKGYGETKPVNSCTTCTEAEHQQNRRTEFRVTN
jgi:outer membrane protein OmpA-like peptidoglycan-associated protein